MRDARRDAARRRLPRRCGSRRSTRCARGCCAARRRHIGLSRDFVIYDSSDQLRWSSRRCSDARRRRQARCSRAWRCRASARRRTGWRRPRRSAQTSWNFRDEQIAKVYERYLQRAEGASALDFDDLLLKTVELFETVRAVRERYAQRVPLRDGRRVPGHQPAAVPADPPPGVGATATSCVVGDPDQSIYKWRGADLNNILDFEHDFPDAKHRASSSATTARRRSSSTRRPRSSARTATARRSGSGPSGRAAARILYYRAGDELEEADFIAAHGCRGALREDSETTVAVLYRTNAQSRAIEDALHARRACRTGSSAASGSTSARRSRTRSPTRLVINPHDDVSLRRVINVPARGIGKGVMEALEQVDLSAPLDAAAAAAAGLYEAEAQPIALGASWFVLDRAARCRRGRWRRSRAFRDLIVGLTAIGGAGVGVDRASARCSIAAATCRTCATSAAKKPKSASRTCRSWCRRRASTRCAKPEPSLGGFVDRLSLLSEVDEEQGSAQATRLADDDAQRQGAGVSGRLHRRPRGRTVPALAARRTTTPSSRRSGGSATSASRAPRTAGADSSAARRRVFGEYQSTEPSRFIDEIPAELVEQDRRAAQPPTPSRRMPAYEMRGEPVRSRRAAAAARARRRPAGLRLRGRGPVVDAGLQPACACAIRSSASARCLSVEPLDDDTKLTVRFTSVGTEAAAGAGSRASSRALTALPPAAARRNGRASRRSV